MFGVKFIKFQPNEYVLKYKNGKVVKEGAGISFFYHAPTTSIAMVPIASSDCPFIFEEVTADLQTVSIQGQATYRIVDYKYVAGLLNLTLAIKRGGRSYISDDLQKLTVRIGNLIRVMAKKHMESLKLSDAIRSSEALAHKMLNDMRENEELRLFGIEIIGLTVLAVRPGKETSRALEAETREKILKMSDDAIYERRNASIEQERGIKENEYNTEIAIENKRRQVRETQLDAEQAEMAKQNELKNEQLDAQISLEEKKKGLIALATENSRAEADAKAYELKAMMDAMSDIDADVVKALAALVMQPQALIANAFQSLAGSAGKIGQLNITPDLLREMMSE
ncbi:MAG: SPFH domain-containing protein [Oscillospiraceae bacterium]|nr:SPFH domain-containing protein [Oscillospiraceae bacterium]